MWTRIKYFIQQYHPVVWWTVTATALTRLTQFMVMPFMALYMAAHTQASAGTIGLAIGMGAASSTAFGFLGGMLADKYGRKGMMVIALFFNALVMSGYANARTTWEFFVLSALNGLTRTLFNPASQAMLTDLSTVDQRKTVFAMRYWAINVGASVGPILGGYLGTVATGVTFYLAAGVSLLYALVTWIVFPESKPQPKASSQHQPFRFQSGLRLIFADRAFWIFMLGGLLVSIGYAQIDSTLPQFIARLVGSHAAVKMFAIVLTANAITVIFLQWPLMRLTNRLGTVRSMALGQFLFAIGFFLFGFSHNLATFIGAMLVITFGEIVEFPTSSQYMSILATESARGTYFGAYSLRQIGFLLGPWLGGLLLEMDGGKTLFTSIAILVALGIPMYTWSDTLRQKSRNRDTEANVQA
ncbi:MAG: hypothetical protein A2201_06410 [Alicyclobacillus sp. RIFOXYA1_FULL_53_8]|nr:MAG: hypothetical protein A2201_06410 [Alicyclobacillus sp. RIFOXYA1_FULL_53_8]